MLIVQEEVHLEILTFDNAKSLPIYKCQSQRGSKQFRFGCVSRVIDIHNENIVNIFGQKKFLLSSSFF